MKKNKQEPYAIAYKQVETYDENNNLLSTVSFDPNIKYRTSGYMQVHPTITTTGDLTVSSPPYIISTNTPSDEGKEIKRTIKKTEQLEIGRLNALKEYLDKFNECKNFHDIYKIIDKMRDEYNSLNTEKE